MLFACNYCNVLPREYLIKAIFRISVIKEVAIQKLRTPNQSYKWFITIIRSCLLNSDWRFFSSKEANWDIGNVMLLICDQILENRPHCHIYISSSNKALHSTNQHCFEHRISLHHKLPEIFWKYFKSCMSTAMATI